MTNTTGTKTAGRVRTETGRKRVRAYLGGDFDGTDQLPDGLADVSGYPALLGELLGRGWSEEDCAKLAGGNILRVMREAEAAARDLSARRPPSTARIEELDGPGA